MSFPGDGGLDSKGQRGRAGPHRAIIQLSTNSGALCDSVVQKCGRCTGIQLSYFPKGCINLDPPWLSWAVTLCDGIVLLDTRQDV